MTTYYITEFAPRKKDQVYCDPTTRTRATIVWFSEYNCTTFQVANIHARMIKLHIKCPIQTNIKTYK